MRTIAHFRHLILCGIAVLLISCTTEQAASFSFSQPVKTDLSQLARFAGPWSCQGLHPSIADIILNDVGISGNYHETQVFAPLTISDQLVATSTVGGTQAFSDNRGGQEVGSYAVVFGIDGALHLDLVGRYTLLGQTVNFNAEVDLASDSSMFRRSTKTDDQPFQTLECTRRDQD